MKKKKKKKKVIVQKWSIERGFIGEIIRKGNY